MDQSCGGGEDLEVTLEGLERCVALARVALEHGNEPRAREHILAGLDDLAPELAALRAPAKPTLSPVPRLTPAPSAAGVAYPCALAFVLPLIVTAATLVFPALRVAPIAPNIATTALIGWACGFRPALVTAAISTACGGYVLSLIQLEPLELPLRIILSGAAFFVVAYTASHHRGALSRPATAR